MLNHCVVLECEIDLHACNDFQLQTKHQPRFQWENIPSPKIIHTPPPDKYIPVSSTTQFT